MTSDSSALEFNGERFTPECVREMAYEHWHRYAWAAQVVAGKSVLDAACGEGYGSNLLAARARSVTGLDISEPAEVCSDGSIRRCQTNSALAPGISIDGNRNHDPD